MLCFYTVAEVIYGALHQNWGAARTAALEREIERYNIVEYSLDIVGGYARLRHLTEQLGRFAGERDTWIAATALWLQCPLVTNNRSDFERIPGLEVRSA